MSGRGKSKKDSKSSRTDRVSRGETDDGGMDVVVVDSNANKTLPGQACKSCHEPDNDSMVQCDRCDMWHHFDCVGVTVEIAERSWRCPTCADANGVQQESEVSGQDPAIRNDAYRSSKQRAIGVEKQTIPSKGARERTLSGTVTSAKGPFPPEGTVEAAKRSFSNKAASDRSFVQPKESFIVNKTTKAGVFACGQQVWPETVSHADMMPIPSRVRVNSTPVGARSNDYQTGSRSSHNSLLSMSVVERRMEEQEREFEQEAERQRREFEKQEADRRREFARQEAERQRQFWENQERRRNAISVRGSSNGEQRSERVGSWIDQTNRERVRWSTEQRGFDPRIYSTQVPPPVNNHPTDPRMQQLSYRRDSDHPNPPYAHQGERRERSYHRHDSASIVDEDPCSLTRNQLAARQGVSKELPTFSGNHEDWPTFLQMFNSTTTMCGFSNEENIIRLQKSLKGKAYEIVRARLTHPANVPGVIRTLKLMFGQPEAIIHSLISKVSAFPPLKEDKLDALVEFAVNVDNLCVTVDACELEDYMYNVSLLHHLVSKLPPTLKLDWARYRQGLPRVNLATFGNWIYSIAEAASLVLVPPPISEQKVSRSESRGSKKGNAFLNAHSESTTEVEANPKHTAVAKSHSHECPICKGDCKSADKCKRFHELTRDARWAAVREYGLCRKCLRKHTGGCKATPCGKNGCTYKHHSLLHSEPKPEYPKPTTSTTPSQQEIISRPVHGCHVHNTKSSAVLFRYLPVILTGKSRSIQTYAFFDDGSELTLLDQELADELQLEGTQWPLCLRWTSGTQRNEKDSRVVSLDIAGIRKDAKTFKLSGVRTVEKLQLPHQTLNMDELSSTYSHLRRLPIDSYHNARPRILIGMKHTQVNLILKSQEGKPDQPIAVKMRLGWTVCGGVKPTGVSTLLHCGFHGCETDTDESLHQTVKQFFSLDSLGILSPTKELLSTEDQRAQQLLEQLTHLEGDRYETGLLWRYDNIRLPDSQPMALRRLNCLEKRMAKDPALAATLNQKIVEYVAKGYARKLSEEEISQPNSRCWYLPVFPVTNSNKPSKVRIVWDAAASVHGISLNSALLKGPDHLCSLFAILLQFREHRVGLTGDLREMFHQVRIRKDDQDCQRFFWRDHSGNLEVYAMQVMTFGACCSPACAQYVKNVNADRFSKTYPEAAEVIKKRHYVDDMLVSVDSEDRAIQLARYVKQVHASGGFQIRNWISNSPHVLSALQEEIVGEKNLDLSSEMSTEKVLGMWWCTAKDVFTYKIGWSRYDPELLTGLRVPTKREVLRVLMSIFDPLGLIAHFLIYLKVLLQEVWRSAIDWDDEIDQAQFTKWCRWLEVLPQVENVQIPRWYQIISSPGDYECQLHTFVDASETAFTAAVYLRFSQGRKAKCILVTSKTRVAPIKFVSIPRLELQAAVVGARLARTVVESLSTSISSSYYWSDSRDVLCWINSDHRRYKQFVAVRVSEILDTTRAKEWRWVPSKSNVADDGTKWETVPDLSPSSRWFYGPAFLRRPEAEWPKAIGIGTPNADELRPSLLAHCRVLEPVIHPENYSSWKRLIHVVAYVHRFVRNCRRKSRREVIDSGPLSAEEQRSAEEYLYRTAQRDGYQEEVAILLQNPTKRKPERSLFKASPLRQLTPWLDDAGVMRMRSRIAACQYATADTKTPIIMPRNHPITTLIINYYHQKFHHQNHESTINELRQKFSIPRIRVCYNKVRRSCQRCKNNSSIPEPPIMADLPPGRLAAFSRPFTHAGVDFFGPMEVVIGRRREKRWGMLVTCLTVRAVYIELVNSLSTNSCIMAIRNFMVRRGVPKCFYSDRGTNFVGASRELQRIEDKLNQEALLREFTTAETTWVFNPPATPHMGGSWERLVYSVKKNLAAIYPVHKPSDEVLRNLLTEVEGILNSRPLTHVPVDDDSAPALTPNHFLLGSSDGTKPLTMCDDSRTTLRDNWRTSQILANQFWKRWLSDYLPEITRRTKWFNQSKPVAVGDIVVIVDPNHPRNCWIKGRVIGVTVSRDGKVRSAAVQTVNGVYERPVIKLAVLDVRCGEE